MKTRILLRLRACPSLGDRHLSQAGAQLGFAVGWTMLTYPLMGAIQEISARIGRTAGRGIALPLLATPKNPQSLSAAACFLRVAMEPRRCRHVVQVNGSAKAWVLQAWQSRKHAMEKPMGSSTDKVKGYGMKLPVR